LIQKNVAVEITESLVMKEGFNITRKLSDLRSVGVQVFIDDFGKGYSSMTHLRHLPLDKLKIDMEFIQDVDTDPTAVEIVRGINNLAHSLQLTTCAEGVENFEQLRILKQIGIDNIQGYVVSRPMSVDLLTDRACPACGGDYD